MFPPALPPVSYPAPTPPAVVSPAYTPSYTNYPAQVNTARVSYPPPSFARSQVPQIAQTFPAADRFAPASPSTPPSAFLTFDDLSKIPPADVLVVLAHPDDEIFLSGTMAKLAQEGKSVQTVYITNGKAGEDVSGRALEGEALGIARSVEVAKALAELSINRPPLVLDFMDGQTANQADGIQEQLRQILRQIQPLEVLLHDVTGHPDHKNVNQYLTRVLNEIAVGQSPDDYKDRQKLAPLFTSGQVYAAVLSQNAQPTFKQSLADPKWSVVEYKPLDAVGMKVFTGDVVKLRTRSLDMHDTQYTPHDMHGLTTFYHQYPYEEFTRLPIMTPASQHGSPARYQANPFLLNRNNQK